MLRRKTTALASGASLGYRRTGNDAGKKVPKISAKSTDFFLNRMDKSAVGHDYIAKVDKHESQKDYAKGFGGKFGVQTDRYARQHDRIMH